MPESRVRKKASKPAHKTPAKKKVRQRRWVAPLMLFCWLLGIAWIVVNYIAGPSIPVMREFGNWNIMIGMGLIAVGFVVSTQWE